jgi:hypothetical protein
MPVEVDIGQPPYNCSTLGIKNVDVLSTEPDPEGWRRFTSSGVLKRNINVSNSRHSKLWQG